MASRGVIYWLLCSPLLSLMIAITPRWYEECCVRPHGVGGVKILLTAHFPFPSMRAVHRPQMLSTLVIYCPTFIIEELQYAGPALHAWDFLDKWCKQRRRIVCQGVAAAETS